MKKRVMVFLTIVMMISMSFEASASERTNSAWWNWWQNGGQATQAPASTPTPTKKSEEANTCYMVVGESKTLKSIGVDNLIQKVSVKDPSIASIDKGNIIANKAGNTTLYVSAGVVVYKVIPIVVTEKNAERKKDAAVKTQNNSSNVQKVASTVSPAKTQAPVETVKPEEKNSPVADVSNNDGKQESKETEKPAVASTTDNGSSDDSSNRKSNIVSVIAAIVISLIAFALVFFGRSIFEKIFKNKGEGIVIDADGEVVKKKNCKKAKEKIHNSFFEMY